MPNSRIERDFNTAQYEAHASEYLESNADGEIGGRTPEQRVTMLLRFLQKKSRIFEIGAGGGLDTDALHLAGYNVTPTDIAKPFLERLVTKAYDAQLFDAKRNQVPAGYDAVYANAVFVHFSPEETAKFLTDAANQLQGQKIIFMSVLKGEGSERSARGRSFERDFHYYQLTQLEELVTAAGYTLLHSEDVEGKWLQVIAQAN